MCDCSPLPSLSFKPRLQSQPQTPRFRPDKPLQTATPRFPSRPPIPRLRIPHRNPRSSSREVGGDSARDEAERQRSAGFDFLELKRELEKEGELVPSEDLKPERDAGLNVGRGGRRQMMKRSSLLAKQVVSVGTARSLGFVSQLWVDTSSWMVVMFEVRPNLLSGDNEKFLLEDICQVGDVVLVQDESVLDSELKMIGLDTLVGYNVITTGRRNVGKVRGYTFNINSGAVESLELDSLGVSIIPSSLISTYCLLIEDVLDVVSDTITVQEDAASRVQRVTKGIWDAQNIDKSGDDIDKYYDFGSIGSFQSHRSRKSRGRKPLRRTRVVGDDWELPMDY